MELNGYLTAKRQASSAMDSTKRSLYYAGNTVDTKLTPAKNQMISVVETLVISYKALEVNRTLVEEQIRLYESMYGMQSNMQAQDMATSVAAAGALNQLNSARKTLAELDAGMLQLKRSIAVQCGYGPDETITIADLPAPDIHFMEGRNPEADKKQAVDGNATVISAGDLSNWEASSYGMDLRRMGENEARGKASASFDAISNELNRQLILADSTATSLRKAELSSQAAEIKFNSGMVGRAEYEGLKMQYLSYQAAAKQNELNLHQAIENYKWAMLGVMAVD